MHYHPPAKRMRKYCSERLNQLLDNASNYSPPDPGLINASNIRDEDIPDDQLVGFDRASSSEEEQSVCSLIIMKPVKVAANSSFYVKIHFKCFYTDFTVC